MLLGAFAELATLGAVLPFLALLADPSSISSIPSRGEIHRLVITVKYGPSICSHDSFLFYSDLGGCCAPMSGMG